MRSPRKPKTYFNEPTGISTGVIFMVLVAIAGLAFMWLVGTIV